MKVSVIIPVYNTKNYLRQCLDSVLNQTLQDIEIHIVDDGSTDGSSDIINEYAEKYPEKIHAYHKPNGGLSSARNHALPFAQGEYLGFVDSDDWIDAEMYEEMYNKAKEENSDIVICDLIDHYPNREIYHHSSSFTNKFSVTASACNKMFRRDFIGNLTFPVGLWYEDLEFTTKNLMMTEKLSVIHKSFYHCHCREVSIMFNDNSEKNLDIITVMNHLIDFVNEHSLQEKHSATLEYLHIDHILISTINRLEQQKNKNKKTVIKAMRSVIKERYPRFYKSNVFKAMPKNRQIVAYLNYIGLSSLTKLLLNIKSRIKHPTLGEKF